MDRRTGAPKKRDHKEDDQDSDDEWFMVGSGDEAPPATPSSKHKRVASSAQEFLRSAASPDNLDNFRQIVSDTSAGIQNMFPNIYFGGRKKTPPPLPMNYVKTTRPTIYPNTPAVAPAPGNIKRPAATWPRLDTGRDGEIHEWMDQVTRGKTPNESPGPVNKEKNKGKYKKYEYAKLTASEQAFLADSDVIIESLDRGVSDVRAGLMSRSASGPHTQSPYSRQAPGTGTSEKASGGVSSGILSGSSLDLDASGNMVGGVFLGYARDSSHAGGMDSEDSRRREVLNRVTRSASNPELRISLHVTSPRKGKRSKAPKHDGFYDVELYADEGSEADDENEERGRPQRPREK